MTAPGCLVVRRLVVDRIRPRLGVAADVFGQLAQHRFELVDATALLVDHLIERLDQVFLMRQLDFNVHKTVFSAHSVLQGDKAGILPPGPGLQHKRRRGLDEHDGFFHHRLRFRLAHQFGRTGRTTQEAGDGEKEEFSWRRHERVLEIIKPKRLRPC